MATNAERIALIVQLASGDAKDKLGRELAAYKVSLALNKGFGNSRRWLGLSDLLANSARSYIDDLAPKIRAIEADGSALASYSNAVESFLAHLDSKYESEWANDAPWRRDKDAPPPPAWQSAKGQLDLAFHVQQSEFARTEQPEATQAVGKANDRAPSVKAGRPPSDDEILAKADEMKARGMDGRTIAKQLRLEPGFENVATTAVRDLIKGRWKPAGRPRKAA